MRPGGKGFTRSAYRQAHLEIHRSFARCNGRERLQLPDCARDAHVCATGCQHAGFLVAGEGVAGVQLHSFLQR